MPSVSYPEKAAGGFTRRDGNIQFYGRVQALLHDLDDSATILEFGAGRGVAAEDSVAYRRSLQELRAPGRTVIGVDVDAVVLTNPRLDRAAIIDPVTGILPLDDASVDLIVSDFTFEHVSDARTAATELGRVLRPGGWICARTPNKWGYIAVGARIVPNRLHVAALRVLQPSKAAEDTFPTRYRMNTRRDLKTLFPEPGYRVYAFASDAEPELYAGTSKALGLALGLVHRAPEPVKSMWNVFIQKSST